MNRRRIVLLVAAVLLLVLLLPFPTRIDQTMHAKLLRFDGSDVAPFEFTMEGWYLNYLVLEDRLKLEFDFPTQPMYLLRTKTVGTIQRETDEYWCCEFSGLPTSTNLWHGTFYLTKNGQYCVLDVAGEECCVASLEPLENPEAILALFPELTK